jgi:hypothetical protein
MIENSRKAALRNTEIVSLWKEIGFNEASTEKKVDYLHIQDKKFSLIKLFDFSL